MKKVILVHIAALLAPSLAFAIMCPTNFNQVYIGDTIEQVTTQCGKPDSEAKKDITAEGPQEWSYFIIQTIADPTMQPSSGTMKMSVAFDEKGKVINITSNGIGVGATQLCGGGTVSLGDTFDTVKSACGNPKYIDKQQAVGAPPPEVTKVVTFTYKTDPPSTLTFENGKLTDKQP